MSVIRMRPFLRGIRSSPFFSHRLSSCRPHGSVALATDTRGRQPDGLRVRLDLHAEALIDEHKAGLESVLRAVGGVQEAQESDLRLANAEITRLGDGFFLLVVAGEYNAGKSSLINALLRRNVLEVGPTPTTDRITKLRYSKQSTEPVADDQGVLVVGEPVEVLASRLQIVDTPGTNAIDRNHETLTKDYLPLCDIVLFVTSADRPFSESERLFLESIRTWGKKVVLIVNKIDLLQSEQAQQQVMDFVSSSAHNLLGNETKVFAVSAHDAQAGDDISLRLRESSGIDSLEEYINDTLDSIERLRLKLKASASIGITLAEKYISILSAKQSVVDADQQTLKEIKSLLDRHEQSIRRGYPAHFARVDNVLMHLLERADSFLDNHVRISNMWRLSNKGVISQTFEDEVAKGTHRALHRQIQGIAEWLADTSSKNLTDATASFSRRVGERSQEIATLHQKADIDSANSSLKFSGMPSGRDIEMSGGPERLVTRLSETADELSSEYLSREEGEKLASKISSSVRLSTGLNSAALLSMSVYLVNAASLSSEVLLADPTLPMLSGFLGAIGLTIVPHQRRAVRRELRTRVTSIRTQLQNELKGRLDEQLSAHLGGIREAIQPFSDFSTGQAEELKGRMSALTESLAGVERLEKKLSAAEMQEVNDIEDR